MLYPRLLKRLSSYGWRSTRARERNRVEDRVKKVTTALAEIARACSADLVRENLRNMKINGISLKAGSVVPADVASDDPAIGEQVLRGKPVAIVPMLSKHLNKPK